MVILMQKSQRQTFDLNAGAMAPVEVEETLLDLHVDGELPVELAGTLLRNGPNPFGGAFVGDDMLAWWVGSAMVHGLTIEGGSARAYRNRWVRTERWAHHDDPSLGPTTDAQNPNVNVLEHGGRVLALGEGSMPFELSAELDTIGVFGTDRLPGGMTAHPKVDPITGELVYFRADWQQPYLRYGVLDRHGRSTVDCEIELESPAMMHDFAITATRSVFLDLNVGYDFSIMASGAVMPLRWSDERGSRLGVMGRSGGAVTWVEIEPCFIQHVVNAYDLDDRTVVLEAVRYPSFLRFSDELASFENNPLGVLWRYTIDVVAGTVVEQQLDDRFVELPRIDERQTGRRHGRVYAVVQPTDREMRGIVGYDLDRGEVDVFDLPEGDQNLEPVFVPRPGGSGVDDGWVLACVYRAATHTTDVVVLESGALAAGPVATIHLPVRVPAGFHGAWVSAWDGSQSAG